MARETFRSGMKAGFWKIGGALTTLWALKWTDYAEASAFLAI